VGRAEERSVVEKVPLDAAAPRRRREPVMLASPGESPEAPSFPARLRAVVWRCAVFREAVKRSGTVGRRGPSPGIHRRPVWRGSPSREAKAMIAAGRGGCLPFCGR